MSADIVALKRAAAGRWSEILARLGGIPAEILDGQHHPCPKCPDGGNDRFRLIDPEAGACYCNQCFSKENGDGIAALQWLTGMDFRSTVAALSAHLGIINGNGAANGNGKREIVAAYNDCDETGALLFQAVRFEPKDFRQRAPKPEGGWIWSTKGVRLVLYRLPELLAADPAAPVFIAEGEKDVDNLHHLGLVATCNAGGAGKWRTEFAEHLEGRHAVLLPDNDDAGRKHMDQVGRSLVGKAASVQLVALPGLAEKGDVSDWLEAGGTVEELRRLVDDAPEWTPPTTASKAPGRKVRVINPDAHLTDLGNAQRMNTRHGHILRYCWPWCKWLGWDGQRWAMDQEGHAQRLAKETILAMYPEAAKLPDHERPALIKHAQESERAPRIGAMMDLARSEGKTAVLPKDLDSDPWLLNCRNGTLDLTTGNLMPHDPQQLITKLCAVEYHPDADCPLWTSTIDQIFMGRAALIEYIRRLFGYCLTGSVIEQILAIFYGVGANGKSTIIDLFLDLMGEDYAIKVPTDLLMVKRGQAHPTEQADLHGKRFIACVETEHGRRMAESLVKEITGGDKIRARRMREDYWQFHATHKIVLACNHKPVVRGTDHAICAVAVGPLRHGVHTGPAGQAAWRKAAQGTARDPRVVCPWMPRLAGHRTRLTGGDRGRHF